MLTCLKYMLLVPVGFLDFCLFVYNSLCAKSRKITVNFAIVL